MKKRNPVVWSNDLATFILESCGVSFTFDAEDYPLISSRWWSVRNIGGKNYLYSCEGHITSFSAHRKVLGCTRGDGVVVDHINGDSTDNRRSNLRKTDKAGNMMNTIKTSATSGVRGVTWNKRKSRWYAYLSFRNSERERIHISGGYHKDIRDAAKSRRSLELKFFGEFAPRN